MSKVRSSTKGSVKQEVAQRYHSILEDLGADPSYDDDGDVRFNSLSGTDLTFIAIIDGGHKEFIRICLPTIYEVEKSGDLLKVLEACNYANLQSKGAKVYVNGAGKYVWVAYEFFVAELDDASIKQALEDSIPVLESAAMRFHRKIDGDD